MFETGHYYIGKHSTKYLEDTYFASGILPQRFKQKGIKYNRAILYYARSSDEAIEIETHILSTSHVYNNDLCLNCYPGSPASNEGKIVISKGNKFRMIEPKLLELYLEDGWEQKGVKRIWVTNMNTSKFILPDEIDSYLNVGWFPGNHNSRGRNFITKNNKWKLIKYDEVSAYLEDGWEQIHNVTNTKVLRKNNIIVKVRHDEVSAYLEDGWEHSSTVEGLIFIKKDWQLKRVSREEIEFYLQNGWKLGNNMTGTIYMTDGKRDFRVKPEEIEFYPHLYIGKATKIYLNNGIKERRVYESNIEQINSLLESGFSFGKLQRKKKILIYKEKSKKMVFPEQLDEFKKNGWTDVFDVDIHYHPRVHSKS